jgi:polyisoprenoid-binding protein YceI
MTKTILITILLVIGLTACSTGPAPNTQAPTAISGTEIAEPAAPTSVTTHEGSTQPGLAATEEPVQRPESPRVQTFVIVPGESTVTYEVGEVFIREGNVFNTAVGVTGVVNGEIQIDYDKPHNSTLGPISVDISKFTSDRNRRDEAIRERFLESDTYPIATFTATNIEGIPQVGEEGIEYPLRITGDMTIREITKEVTFDAMVKVENDVLSGTATTTLLMSDFEFGPIDIIGILKTEDEVKLTLNFTAHPTSVQQ